MGQLLFGALENAALIALEPEEIITTQFLGHKAGAFLLAMQGVSGD